MAKSQTSAAAKPPAKPPRVKLSARKGGSRVAEPDPKPEPGSST